MNRFMHWKVRIWWKFVISFISWFSKPRLALCWLDYRVQHMVKKLTWEHEGWGWEEWERVTIKKSCWGYFGVSEKPGPTETPQNPQG